MINSAVVVNRAGAAAVLAVVLAYTQTARPTAGAEPGAAVVHVSAAAVPGGDGSAGRPLASLAEALSKHARPGTTIEIDARGGPLVGNVAVDNVRGVPGKPITVRSSVKGGGVKDEVVLRGRLRLKGAAHLLLEGLAVEPRPGDGSREPLVDVEGDGVELRDCRITGAPGDGLRLAGKGNAVRRGRVAACEGWGVVTEGKAKIDGLRIESCRNGGLHVAGDALVSNCVILHQRGPAMKAAKGAAVRFYHNLVYDNGGGPMLGDCRVARMLNNILINNYASALLSDQDFAMSVPAGAEVDYNVYFHHPGKDKLLRGLPYGEGVDLAPLVNPFVQRDLVISQTAEAEALVKHGEHSQSLDILQRLTGPNRYTRSYEDLFADFQQENFRPRYTSPAVGRGVDLTADVPTDVDGRPRSAKHPDVGPYAAPAAWWEDIDSGRAVIVDGSVGLDAAGRDCGLGTVKRPYATLAKAAAFARWGSRIYVKDSIYRHTAVQTTFSLGPDSVLSGFPGQRPVFSPSERIDPNRWQRVTPQGLYRIRDWHTFLGSNWRAGAWAADYYGNATVGGPDENVTALCRGAARRAEPFRPVCCWYLDRDTPQVLADGVALQQAGGVLGLEEFPIGTMSAWGRDPSHLRPGSFMVGRRDFLLSKAVGRRPLGDGQCFQAGPNPHPEMNYRIDGHATGYVSQFVARPARAWEAAFTYPGGDRLWKLDPSVTAHFGKAEQRLLKDGWRRVASDKGSAWWVRQFALPAWQLKRPDGTALVRQEALTPRSGLPVGAWLQRQCQRGDPALAAVFDNPYQDYLEARLPAGVDPNGRGLEVSCFNARVEALWRKSVEGNYTPGVNAPGLAMLSVFRTMEARGGAAATAATAGDPWQFGFLVPLGQTVPQLLVHVPERVDPNAEDPWKFTVVDDSLYVFLPRGESPAGHSIEVASSSTNYAAQPPGSNPSFRDWIDAGPLKPEWPAVRVYRTETDFGAEALEPLWAHGEPAGPSPGFALDPADPTGKTLRLLDEVRLDDAARPGVPAEKLLIFRYYEGDPASGAVREYSVSSKTLGPDRRVVLPSRPAAFPPRYAFFTAPAGQPARRTEQMAWRQLSRAASRNELAQGTYYYDAAGHALFVCLFPGSEAVVSHWVGGRSDPMHLVRGLYCLGGNAYGHQKQYGWSAGLGVAADVFDDVTVGFSPGHNMPTVPGSVVRNCTFRWAGADVGRGGEVSGDVRHTVDRIGRPELHVDHCVFDVSNSFLFDGNDNPTKNIPFANHHIWENSTFLSAMAGMQGPWWDQYCFNNVVQNCLFAGRGGVDVEVSENLIARNNLFTTDKGNLVTFRGSDRGCALNNTTFRGGGIWFHSEPERANATEQGAPCYGPSFPVVRRGPVPWLSIEPLRHEKGISLSVRWIALKDHAEVYYCEDWDQPSPLLIDAKGFAAYRAVSSVAELSRATYFHDAGARRLYVRQADGSPPHASSVAPPLIPQTEHLRRDLVYTLTVVRAGRLSIPYRALAKTELEVLEPLKPGDAVDVWYYEAAGRRVERFPITAEMLIAGRPRLRLGGQPADERMFVGRQGDRPPLVRVTGSWTDVRPFEAELLPGGTVLASPLMGLEFHVLRGHFPYVNVGDQFESVFHSRSVYHLASLNNAFLDVRSTVACDRMDNPSHGANYLLTSEHADPSHSRIDHNCYWKDLHAVPGPLSAYIHWGRDLVWNSTADKEGITLAEFREKTGYEAHGLAPASYFTLVCNPLRYDFRPLPDSPLLGAGAAVRRQAGTFLFDPDRFNGHKRFTYKGSERDMLGRARGDRPTIGAVESPAAGARAYYVAPGGKDLPDRGSRAAPFGSFAYALARMRPGDLLVLFPGTYRQPLVVNRSGTARNFLHIVAECPPYPTPARFPTGGASVIDAAGLGKTPAVLLDGCAHVRIAGLRVTGSRGPAAVEMRATRDCVAEYVFVDKPEGAGIRATGRGNTLYECQVTGGSAGYELAGSLCDVRWCSAAESPVGLRTVGPTAGLLLLQNRHVGGSQTGFEIGAPASDVVLDGNWVDTADCAYRVAGSRIMLVNNVAEHTGSGICAAEASDLRIFNNSLLRCAHAGQVLGQGVRSALVLNNLVQADEHQVALAARPRDASIWLDYNVYGRAQLPLRFQARAGKETIGGLAAWRDACGLDRNSRVAPLVYQKHQDANGRWRVREVAITVSNLTHDFNVGPAGANAYPYAGGGTYILDVPSNWKPQGDPARRVWAFDTKPAEGALAARAEWYVARLDYRRRDGSRAQRELYRLDLPPDEIPPGSFCQDAATGRVTVRMPLDAEEPCPIGVHRKLAPRQAIGYYAGREGAGPAGKHRGELITDALAQSMAAEGIAVVDVVANVLTCVCGSPTLERGCPITGVGRDADGMCRPAVPRTMCTFGPWNGPGRFDVGASEHGHFVP